MTSQSQHTVFKTDAETGAGHYNDEDTGKMMTNISTMGVAMLQCVSDHGDVTSAPAHHW